ncbi:glycine-rich domain-containing protein [Brevundimonas sp. TWP1-2-1b1]|uniref:glycine-rich domain-containing protein n=1 Tax=unclassified Brevundimonas TaxID=2622653 RepID=UPI003CEB806D
MATTLNLAVTSGADDGSYSSTGGNSGFTFGAGIYSGQSTYAFIRFLNVAIPQGATITSATLGLEVQTAYGTKWGTLKGIDLDTCPARGVSRASLPYTDAATPITQANLHSTLNVTAIVQEIVSRPGWASGGALGLLGDPTGSDDEIYFFGFEDGYAPTLTVVYEAAAPEPIVQLITTVGAGSVNVPAGYNRVRVECWSGGQGGMSYNGGGDGGNYARSILPVTAGASFTYNVGAGGAGAQYQQNNGGHTWFGSMTTVLAQGGGHRSGHYGDVVFLGGLGDRSWMQQVGFPGGGGGSAHPLGGGGDANNFASGNGNGGGSGTRQGGSGTGISDVEGGTGGGSGSTSASIAGGAPGGGGGAGGNGGRGQIRLTFFYEEEAVIPAGVGAVALSAGRVAASGTFIARRTATSAINLTAGRLQASSTFTQPTRTGAGTIALAPRTAGLGQSVIPVEGAAGVSLRLPSISALSTFAQHGAPPQGVGGSGDPVNTTYSTSTSFTVGPGIASMTFAGHGGGGAGYKSQTQNSGAGGGGGAFSGVTVTVAPGDLVQITVGQGGAAMPGDSNDPVAADGGDTIVRVNGVIVLLAPGGKGGLGRSPPLDYNDGIGFGGAGGNANNGIGSVRYSGGSGWCGGQYGSAGGAGGAASPTGNGQHGSYRDGGAAGPGGGAKTIAPDYFTLMIDGESNPLGGAGGHSGGNSQHAKRWSDGGFPGGGGGGQGQNGQQSGAGAGGQVVASYVEAGSIDGNWLVCVVSLKGPLASADAGQNTQAIATVSLTAPATVAQAFRGSSSTGAIQLGVPAVSAAGSHTRVGSGVVTLIEPSTNGSGAHGVEGSSTISLTSPSTVGAGSYTRVGSGVVSLSVPVVSADGQHKVGANGLVKLGSPTVEAYASRGALSAATVTLTAGQLAATATHAVGANGAVIVSSPSAQGSADHGIAGQGAISLDGPSVEAYAETFNEGQATVALASPVVSADAARGNIAEGQITVSAPAVDADASQITGAFSTIRLAAPATTGAASHGVAASSAITVTGPSVEASGALQPQGQGAVALTAPKVVGEASQAGYAPIRLWTPMAASEASQGVSTNGVINLTGPFATGIANRGATGQGAPSIPAPVVSADGDHGTASSGAIPLAMRVNAGLIHSVGSSGMISLTARTDGQGDHGVAGEGAISLAAPAVVGSLEPGLVHGAGAVLLGVQVEGDIYVDLSTVYAQGSVVLGSPSVTGRALTLPTHGQRTVLVAGENRVVAPSNEARSLNIPNEERVALITPE